MTAQGEEKPLQAVLQRLFSSVGFFRGKGFDAFNDGRVFVERLALLTLGEKLARAGKQCLDYWL